MSERKFIKPARKGASIPDPERGRDLPWEGLEVDWSPYWAGFLDRGDITVTEAEAVAADEVKPKRARKKAEVQEVAPAQRVESEKSDDRPSVDAQPTADPEPSSGNTDL
jgi:hypothetical protein